jgi:hypothetical protein
MMDGSIRSCRDHRQTGVLGTFSPDTTACAFVTWRRSESTAPNLVHYRGRVNWQRHL